jgi:ATP-dependent DNA helicase RecG
MPLPLNINDLLTGQVVEWDRLEFEESFNPLEAMQIICAVAKNFHNLGEGFFNAAMNPATLAP